MFDFQGYFEGIIAKGGLAYIALGLLAFFALSVIWGAFRGARRGASRQLLHSLFMIGAAVAAFFLSSFVSVELFNQIGSMTVEEMIAADEASGMIEFAEEIRGLITSYDTDTVMRILAFPVATVILPIAFSVVFIVVNLLFKLIYLLFAAIARLDRHGGFFKKVGGFLLGAVEGAVVACIIMLPIFGISNTVTKATELVRDDEGAAEFVQFSDECFTPISYSPLAGVIENAGGELLMSQFSTVNVNGENSDLRETFIDTVAIAAKAGALSETSWIALNDSDKAAIDGMIDELDESPYLEGMIAGLLRGSATAIDNGYVVVEAEEPYNKLLDKLLEIFESSDSDNVSGDLRTVTSVLYILSDDGVLAAINEDGNALTDALTKVDADGNTTVKRLISVMKSNERTAPLVSTLTELSVAMLSSSLGLGDDAAEVYENVKGDVADVLAIDRNSYATSDEYIEAVSNELDTKLQENDISLDKEIVDEMAKYIHDNELDLTEITDETIDDVILSYYDAYLKGQLGNQ